MPQCDLVVRGQVVTPGGQVVAGQVVVRNGRIEAIAQQEERWAAQRVVEGGESLILPGVVDSHVHCLSDPSEGIQTATASAAAGGVTTIVEMPFDAGAPVNHVDRLLVKRERVAAEAIVDVAMLATLPKRGGLDRIPALVEGGACGFKLSLFETDPERFPQIPDDELLEAFRLIAGTGLPVAVHAENTEIVLRQVARLRAEGRTDAGAHCESRPRVAESEASLRALEFARATGVRLHICHVSLPEVVRAAEWFRSRGTSVSTETCPHYLLFDDGDMDRLGARAKINPPLRRAEDRAGLWALLGAGDIELVSSDHSPWKPEKKAAADIFDNASGAPGVETLLPLMYGEGVVRGRLTLQRMVELLSERPAELFGLAHRKGRIVVGADADLVVLDPNAEWTLDASQLRSSAGWSPYEGMRLRGRVVHTFVRGQLVFSKGELVGGAGIGQFVGPGRRSEA